MRVTALHRSVGRPRIVVVQWGVLNPAEEVAEPLGTSHQAMVILHLLLYAGDEALVTGEDGSVAVNGSRTKLQL